MRRIQSLPHLASNHQDLPCELCLPAAFSSAEVYERNDGKNDDEDDCQAAEKTLFRVGALCGVESFGNAVGVIAVALKV